MTAADFTAQTTFTIDSAPFRTYRYLGHDIENPLPLAQTSNHDHRIFRPDTIVTVQPEYKANSLWRALVTMTHPMNGDDRAYFLAR